MGIRPNGGGAIPPAQPDNPESRYGDWLSELDSSGEIIGEVWQDTDAKATAGNNGVTDLAGRVASLETRATTAENLLRFAIIAVPPANLADLPSGQVYMDQSTGTISQKP